MSGNAREAGRSTVDRLFTLLDALDTNLTLSEIAQRASMPITTTSRMLAALEEWGGVYRGPDGTYEVGLRLWEVGTRASTASTLREAARPPMRGLVDATGENVQLAVLDQHSALVVENLGSSRAVPTATRVGRRLPLHATAVGRVLLAQAPRAVLASVYGSRLKRFTPYTQVLPGRLALAVDTARDAGYAVVQEEMTLGTASVAVPLVREDGDVIAAISIVGNSRHDMTVRLGLLRRAADETASALGSAHSAGPRKRG